MSKLLKGIYKASQCTDLSDCTIAIDQVIVLIHSQETYNKPVAALHRRLISLRKRKIQLDQIQYKKILSCWDN
jgi:hypothetical protein